MTSGAVIASRLEEMANATPGHHTAHWHHRHHPSSMQHFVQLAPTVMRALVSQLHLSAVQAAAIVGNLGTESRGFTAYHELGQPKNKGGYGWGQWTGPRRRAFFAWADAHKLQRDSAAASLGFLEHELRTSHRHALTVLRRQTHLHAATHVFMFLYEGPGIVHEHDRQLHATIALQAYNRAHPAQQGSR